MEAIPSDMIHKPSVAREKWEQKNDLKKKPKISNYRGLSKEDIIFSHIKNGLQAYGKHSEAERLAKSVVKMIGVENKNVEYLCAAIFLYNAYSSSLEKSSDITKEMFGNDTAAMSKIKDKLGNSGDTDITWIKKKVNILAYLTAVIDHIAEGQDEFKPSQTYSKQQKIEEDEVEEELEEYQEDPDVLPGDGEL